MKKSIETLIDYLSNRPSMIFSGRNDFYSFKIFIEGFFWSQEITNSDNTFSDITKWFYRRINQTWSIHWTDYIDRHLIDLDDNEKKKMLLKILQDYVDDL